LSPPEIPENVPEERVIQAQVRRRPAPPPGFSRGPPERTMSGSSGVESKNRIFCVEKLEESEDAEEAEAAEKAAEEEADKAIEAAQALAARQERKRYRPPPHLILNLEY